MPKTEGYSCLVSTGGTGLKREARPGLALAHVVYAESTRLSVA